MNATSVDVSTAAALPEPPLIRRAHARWLVRAPGRRGSFSPEETAHALRAQRADLLLRLDRRRDVTGIPAYVREEIVDEAIGLVVMSDKRIRNEQHLQGAFWASVGYLLAEHRAGRHNLRVGSRSRVAFEPLAETLGIDSSPFDLVASLERVAAAADFMAQLDPFEQRVVSVMAIHDLGVKRAAKALGEPVKLVLAASRSAERKLEQVAAIAAAGRMCDYRSAAVRAHAQGTAKAEEAELACRHLTACSHCRTNYTALVRQMREHEFQRAASAAFAPLPVIAVGFHEKWLERLTTLLSTGRAPSGTATVERAAGVLGGGGLVKVAAAGTAIVIAGAGVGTKAIQSLTTEGTTHHHAAHVVSSSAIEHSPSAVVANVKTSSHAKVTTPQRRHRTAKAAAVHGDVVPSHQLDYLALGDGAGAGSGASRTKAPTVASTADTQSERAPPRSGGGSSLDYLGK